MIKCVEAEETLGNRRKLQRCSDSLLQGHPAVRLHASGQHTAEWIWETTARQTL